MTSKSDNASERLFQPIPTPPREAVRLVIFLAAGWVLTVSLLATIGREVVPSLYKFWTVIPLSGLLASGAIGLLPLPWGSRNPVAIIIFGSFAGMFLTQHLRTGEFSPLANGVLFASLAVGSLLMCAVCYLSDRKRSERTLTRP